MRRPVLLLCLAALVLPAAATSSGPTWFPAGGTVLAVAQSGGDVAWLAHGASGCSLHVRSAGGRTGVRKLPACVLPEADLAVAGDRWAWGGYDEVRCSETTAAVYLGAATGARLVQAIDGDCLGYRTSYRGLASDGKSVFYLLLTTKTPDARSLRCGDGGPCHWQLTGTKLVRVGGGEVPGVPPAALIAGAAGRLALVQAAASASSNGKTFDWPRAATNGRVDILDTGTGRVAASFRPKGVVRAVALSSSRAVVLVQAGAAWRIEWYDPSSGRQLGSAPAAKGSHLATDGGVAAYASGNSVRRVDLVSGKQQVVGRGPSQVYGVSVLGGKVVWGAGDRVFQAAA